MTESEYLAFEEKAETRHEYVDGYVFAMTGGTRIHGHICTNLTVSLHTQLKAAGCQVAANELKVRIEAGNKYYYPDILVYCEPLVSDDKFVETPVLIVEILSPSTSQIDRREKLVAYQKIASLKAYIIVWQDSQQVEVHTRGADNQWVRALFKVGGTTQLDLGCGTDVCLPLSTIYEGYDPPGRVKEGEVEYCI